MKLTDYVIQFLAEQGIEHVFGVTGGAVVHLFDSADRHPGMRPIFTHHEQSAAMAAEAYARMRNGLGAAFVTTGPGGTNAITGVCAAWLDSIPCVYISGQARLAHTTRGRPLRQLGTQQLDIVPLVAPITKYAAMVDDARLIKYHLQRAAWSARSGRPGPVWIDLPLDLQWASIDPETLPGFDPTAADDRPAPYSPYLIALLAGYSRLMQSLQGDGQDYVPRLKEVTEAIGRLGDPSGIPTPVDRIHADIPELVGKRSELIEVFCYLRNVARQRGDSEAMAEAALTIANLRQALREPAIPVTVDVSKLDLDVLAKALAESGPLTLQRSPAPTVVNGIALTPAELNYTLMALEHLQDFHDTEPGRDWGITDPEIDYLHQRLSGRSTADTRFTKEQPKP